VSIDGDYDTGKHARSADLQVYVGAWNALPGDRIDLDNLGPNNGRYLVINAKRSLFNPLVTVQLRKRERPKLEPAPEVTTKTTSDTKSIGIPGGKGSSGGGTGSSSRSVPRAVASAFYAANVIDRRHYHYNWGGGHASFAPTGGSNPPGYDCSGAVSAVLHHAGLLDGGPRVSGGFESYGDAGAGRYITIYANSEHVYMRFTVAGHTFYWGTSQENPGGGAGFHSSRTGSGFVVRHPSGL
jgi:hypothetical protein